MLDLEIIQCGDPQTFNEKVDLYRIDASRQLLPASKSQLGQFLTPAPVAAFMASLFTESKNKSIRLLDAGAGIGSLSAAFVTEFCKRASPPEKIQITAFEIDPLLFDYLDNTFSDCREICKQHHVSLSTDIVKQDFIESIVSDFSEKLFHPGYSGQFSHIILNPPYKKINSNSVHRSLLNTVGIEANNLYSAFVSLAIQLLEPHGELVAITPRSFCNGPYFKQFRTQLLNHTSLKHIHLFESRTEAFNEDNVLQENIIFHCIKGAPKESVVISSSFGLNFDDMTILSAQQADIRKPDDPDSFIYLPTNELDRCIFEQTKSFTCSLDEINLEVSTGRIVDFRLKELLRDLPEDNTVPLIYPCHIKNGFIEWPATQSKKPNAIKREQQIEKLCFPNDFYVVVNRFSPKEGLKRITAALYSKEITSLPYIAFENHLNVFHCKGEGVAENLAKGLLIYLNSTLVDIFFRQFNGHTQVNAADLRCLPYPSHSQLIRMGKCVSTRLPSQEKIDELVEKEIEHMAKKKGINPIQAKKKIDQALEILKAMDFPREQQNDRSALTLLSLLNLKPSDKWSEARTILIGITPIMDFCKEFYGRQYAPNTRETFRRQTMHQFVQAGLAIENPDQPDRPTNSPKWCYQIEDSTLTLFQHYGTKKWKPLLEDYLSCITTLRQRYAKHRNMLMIPVSVSDGQEIKLSPGKHNELTKAIIEDFASRFIPGAKVVYVGDTAEKWGYFDERVFEKMGIKIDSHGKMPDVLLYYPKKDWFVLVEAVTSHGPVDGKRREELCKLFSPVKDKLVFVTAFPTRTEMSSYLSVISWETEVWVAEAPTHLIHFNGVRFLGPY
jgi:adenine-specific DNA-methyltransferase